MVAGDKDCAPRGAWLFVSRPLSKKKRVYGRNMVPPVRSRAARFAVPPGVSAETPAIGREPLCAATEAVKPTGAPAALARWGIRPLSTGGKWTERPPGGLYTKGEMPPRNPPFAHAEDGCSCTPAPRLPRGLAFRLSSFVPGGAWLPLRGLSAGIAQPPWLPLTRELSPQATEGENSQPASSEHPRFAVSPPYLSLRQALRACHLPLHRGGKGREEVARFAPLYRAGKGWRVCPKKLYSGFAEILAYLRGYWPGVWPVLRMRST